MKSTLQVQRQRGLSTRASSGQSCASRNQEGAILTLANTLGAYGKTLTALKDPTDIFNKVTEPVNKSAIAGQRACIAAGFENQFKNASGWEK